MSEFPAGNQKRGPTGDVLLAEMETIVNVKHPNLVW
jgi:hypothetical protein